MTGEFPEDESRHQRTEQATALLHLAAYMSLCLVQDLPVCARRVGKARTSTQTLALNRFALRASEPQVLAGLALAELVRHLAANRSIRTICGSAGYFPLELHS